MKILRDISAVTGADMPGSVVALGTFDGVHLGHKEILKRCVSDARDSGVPGIVFTFDKHPQSVIRPRFSPPCLTDLEDKLAFIEEGGVDIAVVAHFDEAFARATADEFAREVLVNALRARSAVVGFNYTFGRRAKGTAGVLTRLGTRYGFDVHVVDPVTRGGVIVASTEIRSRLAKGDVEGAAEMLGRPFSVKGRVVKGEGRGRTIGYPTANVAIPDGMAFPKRGVYAAGIGLGELSFHAVANIGTRPTFDGDRMSIEVFILGFDGDLYGETVRIWFVERLRDEIRFQSSQALASQIAEDIVRAEKAIRDWNRGDTRCTGEAIQGSRHLLRGAGALGKAQHGRTS